MQFESILCHKYLIQYKISRKVTKIDNTVAIEIVKSISGAEEEKCDTP